MAPELGRIGPFVIRTYTVLLDLAILAGLAMLAWQGRRVERRPSAWLDAGLVALVGGIVGGRLAHVAIHWAYFSEHPAEIVRVWQGGLNWHGAVAVGLGGFLLGCRLRRVDWRQAADGLAFALPLGAALAHAGCLADRCAHGREVSTLADYPPLVVAELPDLYGVAAPRLASQSFGIGLSLAVLALAWLLSRWISRPGVRFWLVLALLGLASFSAGFARGDAVPMLGALRLDQVLDLTVAAAGLLGAAITAWPRPAPPEEAPLIFPDPLS